MKRLIYLFAMVLLHHCSFAQLYQPFPDSNATWCGNRGHLLPVGSGYEYHSYNYQQHLSGDTIINGITYQKILENGFHSWMFIPPGPSGSSFYYNQYTGAYRDSGQKIYYVDANASQEMLLYDFNLNVGDTLPETFVNFANSIIITAIDSFFDSFVYRKRYHISTADSIAWPSGGYDYASIIEGIGSTHGMNWWLNPYFEEDGTLLAFKTGGVVVYPDNSTICEVTGLAPGPENQVKHAIIPVPAQDFIQLHPGILKNGDGEIRIYQPDGKLIMEKSLNANRDGKMNIESFSPGIYFYRLYEDGKVIAAGKFLKL